LVEILLGNLVVFGIDLGRIFDEENALSLRHGLWFHYIDVVTFFEEGLLELIELNWENVRLREEIVFFGEHLTHLF